MNTVSYDPQSGLLIRRPRQTATAGTMVDGGSAVVTPWGTAPTGRGTEVTGTLARFHDMTPVERRTSIKRSRFIANRLGLGRALVEGSTRYAVGSGIIGYAATGDQAYDDACNKFCDGILEDKEFDLRGELDFYEQQEVIAPAMMTDGDSGVAKLLDRDDSGRITAQAKPRLQLFTTEQIGSGAMGMDARWHEGVERDEFGRALRYRVLQEGLPGRGVIQGQGRGAWRDYDARDFLLVLDPKRVGISRGIPWTHHGQSSAITMMDLKTLEESAAYLNAFFGAVITTADGEIPEGFEREVFRRRFTRTDENKDGAATETSDTELYRKYMNFMGGALIPVLKEGERLQMVKSERPSLTFTGFMDWLVNDIAWGFGIPPAFVWAIAGKNGPETRLTLNQADWFFQFLLRRMVSRFCKPTRDFVIQWGLLTRRLNGGRLPTTGVSPYLCRWHGPRKITIDEGREGKLEMDRIKAGLGTEEEFHGRRGGDGDTVAQARIKEIARRLKWCKDEGVPPELFFGTQPGQDIGMNRTTKSPPIAA